MSAGDRRLVRNAVASYFGGSPGDPAQGTFYQGGSLAGSGLGTAYPYSVKGVPDTFYTLGRQPGSGWGAVLSVHLGEARITRRAIAGKTGGWRNRNYPVTCNIAVLSYEPLLETTEAGVDDLIDDFLDLIYADRTLGTTAPDGSSRLIVQAGEMPDGITVGDPVLEVIDERGKARGGLAITFDVLTLIQA